MDSSFLNKEDRLTEDQNQKIVTSSLQALDIEKESSPHSEVLEGTLEDAIFSQETSFSVISEGETLISLDKAQAELSPEIIKVLADKFNGNLSRMRHVDQRDQIF